MSDSSAGQTTFLGGFNDSRRNVKGVATYVKSLMDSLRSQMATTKNQIPGVQDSPEAIANLTLAYRHLEDASMRLGKAIQAADGGVSVYDKATTVGA